MRLLKRDPRGPYTIIFKQLNCCTLGSLNREMDFFKKNDISEKTQMSGEIIMTVFYIY
jgi:hypothetical protein